MIENNFFKKSLSVLFGIFIFLNFENSNAQVAEEPVNDTIKKYKGSLELENPKSIVEAYTYNPEKNLYYYNNLFGEYNVAYPQVLTPKEYENLMRKIAMKDYFKKKMDALDGKKEGAEEERRNLLPKFYVRSGLFETIFGSNTIDIQPRGSVEVDLGVRYTKQDNPSFSPRNQSNTTFDFNQRINMSLAGTVGTRLGVNINYDTQSVFSFQNMIKLSYIPGNSKVEKGIGTAQETLNKAQGALNDPKGLIQNQINGLGGGDDNILQEIEVGNISMPLNNTLIRGAQSLFGVKARFKFGRTSITGVFSEQKSQTKSVQAQGGGTLQDFNIFALEYDENRHFFMSQYFRNQYDVALKNYPFINSRVNITRVEVWVTNRQNRITAGPEGNNLRNIIALQDLGEGPLNTAIDQQELVGVDLDTSPNFFNALPNTPATNANNKFDPSLINLGGGFLNASIRNIGTADQGFNIPNLNEGLDYAKLENARKLTSSEFTFHKQLGYISLQQKLNNDEVLAVAYQYTIGDKVYQVGEFGNDGVPSTDNTTNNSGITIPETNALVLKLLKSTLTAINQKVPNEEFLQPTWNLMMKNIYQIPGAYDLKQEDFKFNILYQDPSPLNYITPSAAYSASQPFLPLPQNVADTPLLKVLNVDKLNYNNDPEAGGDGFFDFIPGITVDQQNGRLIFTTIEPFGKTLYDKLKANSTDPNNYFGDETSNSDYNANQRKYVFRSIYTKSQALALQDSEKNKYLLRGKFKSTGGDGIPIGAFNVPRGSVVVTAGGRQLVEGVDYTVNYQQGRVKILDPSLQNSSTPINISVENNSVFGQQTRRFYGFNIEHQFNKNFVIGGTFLKLSERPFTQKSSFGQESVDNTIIGFNGNYSTEVPFLTRMVNKLPNMDTDVPSNISIRGEVAYLIPDSPQADRLNGEQTIYVDDFEGTQNNIDVKAPLSWFLSSVPVRNNSSSYNFNESLSDIQKGFKRSKLSWYTIDPLFYTSERPAAISDQDVSLNKTRRVFINELFPVTDIAAGQQTVINSLDLTYFPKERGPYNFNPLYSGTNNVVNPEENFGGITRALTSTNFEQSNVEYIQFWLMDPYYKGSQTPETPLTNTGQLYFNLGEISEDVLTDGRKQYENGLPSADNNQAALDVVWGKVPSSQSLIYAFDVNEASRPLQDVGLDGINDALEASKFPLYAGLPDPAADNYNFYLSATGDIIQRYKNYNGTQGNSPVSLSDSFRGNTTLPDVEDINRDNTMNTINAYYEYKVEIQPNMPVGVNYITDAIVTTAAVSVGSGNQSVEVPVRWLQFKIPVTEPTNVIGSIADFRSIRFMRMFLTNFTDEITIRFGALDLIRTDWRRYTNTLDPNEPSLNSPETDNTVLDVLTVNLQENGTKDPVNYVMPPGVQREQLFNNQTVINQNEQSLALRVSGKTANNGGLEPGDSRGVFKGLDVDLRQFKKLRMFLHAEPLKNESLQDDQLTAFIRIGTDFTDNFYQIELPLKVTNGVGRVSESEVWKAANEMELPIYLLNKLKILGLNGQLPDPDVFGVRYINEEALDPSISRPNGNKHRIGIKGNPNLGQVRTLMVGLKNNSTTQDARGEVWFNELRVSDMDNKGGMAAILNIDGNAADLLTFSATGKMSTAGFGSLEQKPNERSREDLYQYDIVTNLNAGKLLPKKWNITLPVNYGIGEQFITPEYDPYFQDLKLDELLNNTSDATLRDNIKDRAIDYTRRESINFIGVKKDRGEGQKQYPFDIENFTFSHSHNEVFRKNFEIENYQDKQTKSSIDYTYSFQTKAIEPLKKNKFMSKSKYWKLLQDFNFNYLPTNINFSINNIRQFNKQQFRQIDVEGLALDPLFRRNYLVNYQYGFNYNLTKSLKLNYTASTGNIVRNYFDSDGNLQNYKTIYDGYFDIGDPNQHNQQLILNYDLPLDKIPFLAFIKSNYNYTGIYNWQRPSLALRTIEDNVTGELYNLGNTIQNSGAHRLNTTFNMDSLYKYIGLVKGPKKPKVVKTPEKPKTAPKPGEKIVKPKTQADTSNPLKDALIDVATMVKNIQINYTKNTGAELPGYLPSIGFFGSSLPTMQFVLGLDDDVRQLSASRGYLTQFPDFNQNYTKMTLTTLQATAKVELFKDVLTIDFTADRNRMDNFTEQFDVSGTTYNSRSPQNIGNFSISTNMFFSTAFWESDENSSQAFNNLRQNRLIFANRLAERYYGSSDVPRYGDAANPIPAVGDPGYQFYRSNEGYPIGFGKNNQAVLIPAFHAAYHNSDANKTFMGAFRSMPLPNWNLKFTGLMKLKFFKERFKRFSIQHGYKASYTINSYRTNLAYNNTAFSPNGRDNDGFGNFINPILINNVNIVEQFNPLVRLDFEMNNSLKVLAEMKKDRSMSLSFDNNLLTEVQGQEYTLGLGYRVKDVTFASSLADNPQGVIKSDINMRADFSLRNNKTIVRNLDYDNNLLGAGQYLMSVKFTADYTFSKNLTAIFFYDHTFTKAVISTAFPLTTIRGGFTLRYNFGN
jgi:cell surface protein SprA